MHGDDSIRVTVVVESDAFGGAEVYVAALLRRMQPRYRMTLLARHPARSPLLELASAYGVAIRRLPPVRGKIDLIGSLRQFAALRVTRPDLVHVNMCIPTNGRFVVAWGLLLRRPVVITLHLHAVMSSWMQRTIFRKVFSRVTSAIAVSDEVLEQLHRDLGVSVSAAVKIPNGVEVAKPVGYRERSPVRIGGVGRLVSDKGFDLLIDAAKLLRQRGICFEMVVAGEGAERHLLEERADGLPITFVGFVDDIDDFFRELDIFCLPSRAEGLPLALLEAMMRGLPCVATGVGDVALALNGAGVVVEPDDPEPLANALAELIGSPQRRRVLGDAARTRALEHHTLTRMVSRTAEVYEAALSAFGRRPGSTGRHRSRRHGRPRRAGGRGRRSDRSARTTTLARLVGASRVLREDSELRRRMVANARELARSHLSPTLVRAYEQLYAKIV